MDGVGCRWALAPSALRFEDGADFTIDAGRILGGGANQVGPLLVVAIELGLSEKIRSLENGFDRIAQIVGERSQVRSHVFRYFLFRFAHDGFANRLNLL
jgi:hypothetical protein